MKNKFIFAIVLAIVFIASSLIFSQTRMVNQNGLDMTIGLAVMVVSYFVGRVAKSNAFKNSKQD